jgi:uncharacterized protein (DUF433 family)
MNSLTLVLSWIYIAMNMVWQEYISSDSKVMHGKPVIKGTRIPVDLIIEKLRSGETSTDILLSYPSISQEAINACLYWSLELS